MEGTRSALTEAERRSISFLARLVEQGASENDRGQIVKIAENADSPQVRNAAAIAMADLHVKGADQILINLLRRSDTKKQRGSLLYAFNELNGLLPISLVVSLLFEEDYEGREETLLIVGKKHVVGTLAEWEDALTSLRPLAESKDDYTANVGRRAIRWLIPRARSRRPSTGLPATN